MIQYPHCKINLGLSIVAKRADGFHELETVFYPVALKDILEITPAKTNDATSFSNSGLLIPGDSSNNLCLKAYHLLKVDFPSLPEIQMHLHKIIPMGAGLGGGSSDGTAALKILNSLFQIGLSLEQLLQYAEKQAFVLSSIAPFSLIHQTCRTSVEFLSRFIKHFPPKLSPNGTQIKPILLIPADLFRIKKQLVPPD